MSFAFNPDVGPPRLIRFVDPGTLPGIDLLAVWCPKDNLLVINRELFNLLTPAQKAQTLRTQQTSLTAKMECRAA